MNVSEEPSFLLVTSPILKQPNHGNLAARDPASTVNGTPPLASPEAQHNASADTVDKNELLAEASRQRALTLRQPSFC